MVGQKRLESLGKMDEDARGGGISINRCKNTDNAIINKQF
jgi:hypothetical protein